MTHAAGAHVGNPRLFHIPHSDGSKGGGLPTLFAVAVGTLLIAAVVVTWPAQTDTVEQPAAVPLGPVAVLTTGRATLPGQTAIKPPQAVGGPLRSTIKPPTGFETVQQRAVTDAPAAPAVPALPEAVPAPLHTGLRDTDLAALPGVQALARQLGAPTDAVGVTYADLTGDGAEEAVILIGGNGTYGTQGFVVYTQVAGRPEAVLVRLAGPDRNGPVVIVDRGQLTETNGVYGPADANCCPTSLVKTYYRWDGRSLVFDRMETITTPHGKDAD